VIVWELFSRFFASRSECGVNRPFSAEDLGGSQKIA
jgi:hypothetical protein